MTAVTATNVYNLRYSEGCEWLLPLNESDFDLLRFRGEPRTDTWKPVSMRRLRVSDQGKPLKPCDFPACSGGDMLLVDREAQERIGPYLQQYGELLPLACDEGQFWTLNVTRIVNALDEDESEVLRASDTGAILMIKKYAFDPNRLRQAQVFKLPQLIRGPIYVTNAFVEVIKGSGLAGLEFLQVWGRS